MSQLSRNAEDDIDCKLKLRRQASLLYLRNIARSGEEIRTLDTTGMNRVL